MAVLLPGGRYTAARPLLHYARAVLVRHGWTVQEVWWEPPTEFGELAGWVDGRARQALDAEAGAGRLLVVGKSLGTMAAPVVAERGLPACWLTPLLTIPETVAGLAAATAPSLLIGGSADGLWDGKVAAGLPGRVVELAGADHALEDGGGDPVVSVGMLRRVVEEVDAFVVGLE